MGATRGETASRFGKGRKAPVKKGEEKKEDTDSEVCGKRE